MNTKPIVPSKIPAPLVERAQWVLWRSIIRGGEPTKLPFTIDGQPASSTDPKTWSTFADVNSALTDRDAGIGFVFARDDPFCGIDLDGCRDPKTGKVADWAADWIRRFDSYTEVSPSETGVKIFVLGKNPFQTGKNHKLEGDAIHGKTPGVEMYDHGRYFAMTGWRLSGVSPDVEDRQDIVQAFADAYWKQAAGVKHTPAETSRAQANIEWTDEAAVIERARAYVAKMPPGIQRQRGSDKTFAAACVLCKGFGLAEGPAFQLLSEYNQRCKPLWSESELRHKIDDALKADGPVNYLRDVPPQRWSTTHVPDYAKDAPQPKTDGVTLADAAEMYLADLDSGNADLIELGVSDLDYALGGGVAPGEMVIIAARPSHGKSAVALQCLNTAAGDGMKGLFLSEEMSIRAVGKRTIQYASDTPEEHWKTSRRDVVRDIASHFCDREMTFIVEGCRTARKACETIEWYVENKGVKVVAVDYAQLLSAQGSTRYEQVTQTSIALRSVANKTGVLLIALCQLSRGIESRDSFTPRTSDLRDSGQLEQDSDVIIFLVWPHKIDSKNDPHVYQVFISKNRNRPIRCDAFECRFEPSRQRVVDAVATHDFGAYSR